MALVRRYEPSELWQWFMRYEGRRHPSGARAHALGRHGDVHGLDLVRRTLGIDTPDVFLIEHGGAPPGTSRFPTRGP